MLAALHALAGAADRAGWDAHANGRPDLRDAHWRYRDAILRALRDGTPMNAHRQRPPGRG